MCNTVCLKRSSIHLPMNDAVLLAVPVPNDGNNNTSNTSSNRVEIVRKDNHPQKNRNGVRRSIFGHYFQEKSRRLSSISSSSSSSSSSSTSTQVSSPQSQHSQTQTRSITECHSRNSKHSPRHDAYLPVDYRVFAPTKEQLETSTICNRFRELNQQHEHDYELFLERKILIEQSLPPFPSPLKRFCSETTTTVAGMTDQIHISRWIDTSSSSLSPNHYCGGVYSLITPVSILRPGKYNHTKKDEFVVCSQKNQLKKKIGIDKHVVPPSMSSSFNPVTGEGEEKKETDSATSIHKCSSEDLRNVVDSETEIRQTVLPQEQRHLCFDPRVTVTEFDDSIREWYTETELNQLKREAIALAQSYLKEHPDVARWYRTAKLDRVTKTYRKRALFSLPVYSSSYSNKGTMQESHTLEIDNLISNNLPVSEPSSVHQEELIKKILIVDPHPAIASLFWKSMKSMFPSAEVIKSLSVDHALEMIKPSLQATNGKTTIKKEDATSGFDVIIVEQSLDPFPHIKKKCTNMDLIFNNINKGPFGIINILMNNNRVGSIVAPATKDSFTSIGSKLRDGSELIELISNLMKQDQRCPASSCLVIGVSVQPDRDAAKMRLAGADFVWGKPIPTVGQHLRNELLSKLLTKRSTF